MKLLDTSPLCEKCNHTGLLPFKNKEGKVIPFAFVDCECKQLESEHYQPLRPEDFDFPCSDSWRGYYHEQYGGRDPAYQPNQPDLTSIEERIADLEDSISKPGTVPRKYQYQLEQIKGQVLHLQRKVEEKEKKKQDYY